MSGNWKRESNEKITTENTLKEKTEAEKVCILDKDLCIIDVE